MQGQALPLQYMIMAQTNDVNANGLRLHYRRTGGDKPQLLLLHGLTDNGGCWNPVIEQLKADYDCIAPDARGHGLSDAPAQGYTPEDHAADAAAFIQALGLNKPIVMGHSMGGMESTVLAATHPELVRAVILEDPAWFDPGGAEASQLRERANTWRDGLRNDKSQSKTELIATGQKNNPKWSAAELDAWSDAKAQAHEQVLDYILTQHTDWRALLKQIPVPVLLITGDTNVIISPELGAAAQAINPKVEFVVIKNAGHSVRRDNFADYMAAVKAFLSKVA